MRSNCIKGLASYTIIIVIFSLYNVSSHIGGAIEYKLVPTIISIIAVLPVLALAILILIGDKTTKSHSD